MNCKLTALMGAAAGAAAGHAFNKPLRGSSQHVPATTNVREDSRFSGERQGLSCDVCNSAAADGLPVLASGGMANLRGTSRRKPILWEGPCQCQWEARAGCYACGPAVQPWLYLYRRLGARCDLLSVRHNFAGLQAALASTT